MQCIGPATLSFTDYYDEEQNIKRPYTDTEIKEHIKFHIGATLYGLNAKEIIVFLDEPILGNAGFKYEEVWDAIFSDKIFSTLNIKRGIHVCALTDFDRLFKANIDIISFDASHYDLTMYGKYNHFRRKGGRIAWGISNAEDITDFHKGDLITMPCGLGGMNLATGKPYTEEESEKALEMLVNAAEKHR
ncbi:MAG: hypothetical protein V1734_03830 [Nanoarchaeota archaeon]